MTLQFVTVNDAAPAVTADAGLTTDGTTITSAKIIAGTSATMSGTLGVTGNVAVNTNKFNITAASGNTAVAGTLTSAGAVTCSTTCAVTGVLTCGDAVAQPMSLVSSTNGAKVIDVTAKLVTYITNSTADIDASLADGVDGQEIIVILGTRNTNDVVITPANLANGTTITLDASGERAHLIFDGTNWHIVSTTGVVA